jgi:hypothetical protein
MTLKTQFTISLFLLFLAIFSRQTAGQNIKNELLAIKKHYSSAEKLISYNLRIIYYDRHNLKNAIDSSIGSYKSAGPYQFMELEGIKKISDGKVDVFINTNNKTIAVNNAAPADNNLNLTEEYINSLLDSKNHKLKINSSGVLTKITTALPDLDIDSLVITYDNKRYLFNSVAAYYNKPINKEYDFPPAIVVKYLNQKESSVINKDQFDLNEIFLIKNKEIQLTNKYKKYALINNLIL